MHFSGAWFWYFMSLGTNLNETIPTRPRNMGTKWNAGALYIFQQIQFSALTYFAALKHPNALFFCNSADQNGSLKTGKHWYIMHCWEKCKWEQSFWREFGHNEIKPPMSKHNQQKW